MLSFDITETLHHAEKVYLANCLDSMLRNSVYVCQSDIMHRGYRFKSHCMQRLFSIQVTQLEQNMNVLVVSMFLVQVLISMLCALGQNSFNTQYLQEMWYVTAPM